MRLKKGFSGVGLALLTILFDRLTKQLAMERLQSAVEVIPGVLRLRSTVNTGMAFSLLNDRGGLLIVLSLIVVAGLSAWLILRPSDQSAAGRAGLWMVVGGGLGNVYDRVAYGAVIDFIEPVFVRFAVFNLADTAICIGAALTVASVLMDERKKEHAHVDS